MNVISIERNCFFTISSKPYLFLEWLFLMSAERKLIALLVKTSFRLISFHLRNILSDWKHFSTNYLDKKYVTHVSLWYWVKYYHFIWKLVMFKERKSIQSACQTPVAGYWQQTIASPSLSPFSWLKQMLCAFKLICFLAVTLFFPPEVNFANPVLLYLMIQLA